MARKRDEHGKPVIRAFVALPGETLVEVTERCLPGGGFCATYQGLLENATNLMNPAEEIVKHWLQQQGYFFESSVKVGRKEIDLLAMHPFRPEQKRHMEVSVSLNMVDTKHTPQSKARHYLDHHFNHLDIKTAVEERLGTSSYTRELVVGDVRLNGREALAEFTEECRLLGITVVPFSLVLNEVAAALGTGTQLNCIIKTVQLCEAARETSRR